MLCKRAGPGAFCLLTARATVPFLLSLSGFCALRGDEVEEPSTEITLRHLSPHQRRCAAHIPSARLTKTNLPEPAVFPV